MNISTQSPQLRVLYKIGLFIIGIFIGIGIFGVCFIFLIFYSIYNYDIKPVHYFGYMTIENGDLKTTGIAFPHRTPFYSIAYSEERFSQIKQGMTKEEVVDLMGFPLFPDIKKAFQSETWEYAMEIHGLVRKVIFKDNIVEKTVKIK